VRAGTGEGSIPEKQLLGSAHQSLLGGDLDLLARSAQVTPQPFRSQMPLLGPLIVAFRNFINNLATRWYVQPLLEQQVAFNASVSRLLSQVYLLSEEHQAGFLAEQVADLRWQLLALKDQVTRLEEELDERSRNAPR
jgi:hypothetical protein